jgi:nicotinate-nucleotide--dimethylbenzimidazole phosphoribosyltransferase
MEKVIIDNIIRQIRPVDREWQEKARTHLAQQARPIGSLGRLEELAIRVVAIQRSLEPKLNQRIVLVMAGDHGVVEEGVSAFRQEVTAQMVTNFVQQGASINVLASQAQAQVIVVDLGVAADLSGQRGIIHKKVDRGTRNFTRGPAMTRYQAIKAIANGIEVFQEIDQARGIDILLTGDMGIGNTTPSSAVIAAASGLPVSEVVGRGTGIDDQGLTRKILAIEKGLKHNQPQKTDPVDILSKVGGFELGGLCGAILAAAAKGIPILVDGFISTASLLLASLFQERVLDYTFASHLSNEQGHQKILAYLGLNPILDLGLRLGEGTGAALALHIMDAALKIFREVAPFAAARVTVGREEARVKSKFLD